ncbi:hypothetical protein N7G274_000545 [Stereocaulon virgatum]|uniref:Uncharacterized protein n=1 Tax=Stereocaulon virgatum TaxID=373712 RepID=A0ABR4AU12_9LECA
MKIHLWAFGSNGAGQLGIGHTQDVSAPQICTFPNPYGSEPSGWPMRIAAGGNHTLLLLDEGIKHEDDVIGTLYYAGIQRDGSVQPSSPGVPQAATTFQKGHVSNQGHWIRNCSAFWDGSVFLGADNEVYTTGIGSKGELGLGEHEAGRGIVDSGGLQMLQDFPPDWDLWMSQVVDVASGVDHTVLVLQSGEVWGWGNGRKGQLSAPCGFRWAPQRLISQLPGHAPERAVCGREFTFLLYGSGHCETLGSDKYGVKSQTPAYISNWKDVGASWGSIFVLKKDGKIDSWGRNDHGQLAPPDLPDIEQFAVGSEHVVALTKEGKVICWGWGEHGNCGAGTDENGDIKGRWNEIPIAQHNRVLGVGAGCATSFFWTEDVSV